MITEQVLVTGSPSTARSEAAKPRGAGLRSYHLYSLLLGPVLGLYLLLDRGIAHVHVPGTPLYVGECLLGVGIVAALSGTRWIREAIANDSLLAIVAGFMAWGLARTIPNLHHYGVINSLRDAALWYYAAFAVLSVAAARAVPDLPSRLARQFSRFLPWLIIWLPITLLLGKTGLSAPHFPTSDVGALSYKGGNIAVAGIIALAFLWLVPGQVRSTRARNLLSLVVLMTQAVGATQNRAGALAALIAAIIGLTLLGGRERLTLLARGLAIVGLALGLAWTTNLTIQTHKRTISVDQLIANARSVAGQGQGKLLGTSSWREHLWTNVLSKEVSSGRTTDGFGFGPNLAVIGGVPPSAAKNAALELRSPHNSHLDVFARMGAVGIFLWMVVWIGWMLRMTRARRRYTNIGDLISRRLVEVCIIAIVAILVNCGFDPTLESPQVAILTWTIFGIGIVLSHRPVAVDFARRRGRHRKGRAMLYRDYADLGNGWHSVSEPAVMTPGGLR